MTMVPSERQMAESVQNELAYWREKAERLELGSVTSPAGYRLVPVEPTEDMLVAFYETYLSKKRLPEDDDGKDWWAAMLRAALSPRIGEDDEALIDAAISKAVDAFVIGETRGRREEIQSAKEANEAEEALRRRIAGLRETLDRYKTYLGCDDASIEARLLAAERELAEVRDKVIEECAAQAESLRHLDYSSESPEWCSGTEDAAAAIRALKTQEPTHDL